MPRTVLKVCGGGGWWLRPILVFSLSLDQAEQLPLMGQVEKQWPMREVKIHSELAQKFDKFLANRILGYM